MKTTSLTLCTRLACTLVGMTLAGQAVGTEEFVIRKAGYATPRVVLLPGSGPAAEEAAQDLRRVLNLMGGDRPGDTGAPAKETYLVVGLASAWARLANDNGPVERLEKAPPESALLKSTPTRLLILGKDPNGVSHGVYTLLRDLGCRWYFIAEDWEVIPRHETISVRTDRVEGPVMRVRKINSGMGQGGVSRKLFENWQRRNRMGSAYGRTGIYHAYANYVPESLFKEHPEYFAWVSPDGVRPGDKQNGLQPCTTRPEVVKLFTDGALAMLRKRVEKEPSDALLLSVSPNDNTGNMCRCDRCREVGSYSDCALLLANQVAEAIHDEFPSTLVGFMAYGRVSPPPSPGKTAHPNVIVSMATAYTWGTFAQEMLEKWPAVVRHLIIREYYCIGQWGGADPDYTGPKIDDISQSIKWWNQHGLEGVEAEMNHSWASCGHRFWAAAELMWNPALSADGIKDDFYTNCWGAAAGPMRRYYERWESGQAASPRVVGLAFQDLAEATRLAATPEVLKRVNLMTLYLHQFHLLAQTTRMAEECRLMNLGEEETQQRLEKYCEEGNQLTYRWKDAYLLPIQPKVYQMPRLHSRYTPAEVKDILDRDLAFYRETAAPLVETGGVPFSMDLVPLRDTAAHASAEQGEQPVAEQLGSASTLFRATAGEDVSMLLETPPSKTPPEDGELSTSTRSRGRVELWFLGKDGQEKTFIEFQIIRGDSQSIPFRFKIPDDGLYMLNTRIPRGTYGKVSIENRPFSIVADMKTRKDIANLARIPRNDRGVKPASLYYFHVPPGTRHFAVQISRLKSARPMDLKLETISGDLIREENATKESEWLVDVPPGKDGGVWRLWFNTDSFSRLGFDGIPPHVATHPGNLLIPREYSNTN